jgi:hypothetical protein
MKKLFTLGHLSAFGSGAQLGTAWVAAFLGVLLIIATAVWAATSLA